MPGSAYHRIGTLATHPMFRLYGRGPLLCPLCATDFGRVPEAEKHLLAHDDLTAEVAWRFLSGRTWEREQPKHADWPTTEQMLSREVERIGARVRAVPLPAATHDGGSDDAD